PAPASTPRGANTKAAALATPAPLTGERAALLKALGMARFFLRNTLDGLTDEQAGARSTVSELCLGGLIQHVASREEGWVNFVLDGSKIMKDFEDMTEADYAARDEIGRASGRESVETWM